MNKKIGGRRRRPSLDNLFLNFNSSIMETLIKPKIYDAVNSIYLLWVAYKYEWISEKTNEKKSSMNYYQRFVNDKDYSGNKTEINRIWNFLIERMSLDYLEQKNPMQRIILYRNNNRGQSIKNTKNPELWRIEMQDGFMQKRAIITTQNMSSEFEAKGWIQLLHQLEEYSKSQKSLLKQ